MPTEKRNTHIEGMLEIDSQRGVIYFHTADILAVMAYGVTPLRICRLPTPVPTRQLDITHMHGCSWLGEVAARWIALDPPIPYGPLYGDEEADSFCKRGLNKAGVQVEIVSGERYLIGDITYDRGHCDHCCPFFVDDLVSRYRVLLSESDLDMKGGEDRSHLVNKKKS